MESNKTDTCISRRGRKPKHTEGREREGEEREHKNNK
jgi:hypothetical protein